MVVERGVPGEEGEYNCNKAAVRDTNLRGKLLYAEIQFKRLA